MSTIINATTTNGVVIQPDNSGSLVLQTNSGTTAVTIDTSQNVGIGTASPLGKLNVSSASFGGTVSSNGNQIVVENSGNAGITIASGASSVGNIFFADSGDTADGYIQYDQSGRSMRFGTATAERMRIDSSGNVGIGVTPSAWGSSYKVVTTGVWASVGTFANADGGFVAGNAWNDGTNWKYRANGTAEQYRFLYGEHVWANAASGTAGNTFSFTDRMTLSSSGSLILAGSTAQKATGTTWSNPSDQRLKDNIRDYTKGTTELMQVRVREWEYNGKGNTTEGLKGLGVVADEVMTVLPNTVETYNAKLNADDEEDTEIKKFDATEITWLLVKTVQEQQAIINDLKARVETLEAK